MSSYFSEFSKEGTHCFVKRPCLLVFFFFQSRRFFIHTDTLTCIVEVCFCLPSEIFAEAKLCIEIIMSLNALNNLRLHKVAKIETTETINLLL